jgi:TolB-like protein
MRRLLILAIILAATGPRLLAGQDPRPGIAVLAFENGGSYGQDREDYDALRRGIAGVMISELSQDARLRLVDRAETQRILDEQNLTQVGRVDAATAARVGQLIGARFMVTGTFIDLYGEFRLDARIINVETGEILKTVRSDPKHREIKQLHTMIRTVASRLLEEIELPSLETAAASGPSREVPTEALSLYSRALLYEDRGDKAKAIEYYEKALLQFPEFTEAREGLRKARGSGS